MCNFWGPSCIYGYSISRCRLPHHYGNSHTILDHSVTCHPKEASPPLPQPKLVLDLATPGRCKAELTFLSFEDWNSCVHDSYEY